MTWMLIGIARRRIVPDDPIALEIGAMYWHLVDIIWMFLWPLLYLIRRAELTHDMKHRKHIGLWGYVGTWAGSPRQHHDPTPGPL